MKKVPLSDFAAVLIWLLPLGYLLYVYGHLPATVPLHYGFTGKPDRFGTKNEFVTSQLILAGVSGILFLLLKYITDIDPKKRVKYGTQAFQKLRLVLVMFISVLSFGITSATVNQSFKTDKLLPVISLMFVFLGNLMYNIKPNYFVGVRTPWTLEDPDNWKATHRLAAKIWVCGGIVLMVLVFFLPIRYVWEVFSLSVIVMALIPVIYSFIYFRKHRKLNLQDPK